MKKIILIFALLFLNSLNIKAKEYILTQHGKRILLNEHIYTKNDSLKVFKLEGTFEDNAGNFGKVAVSYTHLTLPTKRIV